jgi:prevent-host-death family protein
MDISAGFLADILAETPSIQHAATQEGVMSKTISANEAKNRLGTWLAHVNNTDEEVIIERHGKPKAVIMSFEAFEEVKELREKQRRAKAVRDLRALQEEISSRNRDLTEEQIEEIANRFSHDIIDDMVADGKISFERDLRKQG